MPVLAYQHMAYRSPVLVLAATLVAGCGSPNPRIVESTEKAQPAPPRRDGPMTEADKIRALVEVVRASELTFVQNGEVHTGAEAAAALEYRLHRVAAGLPTAKLFIERIGSGLLRAKHPDIVRLEDGTEVPLRDWLLGQLERLERAGSAPEQGEPAEPESAAAPSILDALRVVERSGLRFVAPPRTTAKGEIKGKRKEYSSTEFSGMLRKKWEFLGKGVEDFDTFIEVIATDALSSLEPYRVVHEDGTEEEFRPWLLRELGAHDDVRHAAASGT